MFTIHFFSIKKAIELELYGDNPLAKLSARKITAVVFRHNFCTLLNQLICTHMNKYKKTVQTPILRELYGFSVSEASGTRTPDNLIKSQVLYHLS